MLNTYDVASYAEENRPQVIGKTLAAVEKVSDTIFKQFNDNQMQENSVKCHVLISTDQKNPGKYKYITY